MLVSEPREGLKQILPQSSASAGLARRIKTDCSVKMENCDVPAIGIPPAKCRSPNEQFRMSAAYHVRPEEDYDRCR